MINANKGYFILEENNHTYYFPVNVCNITFTTEIGSRFNGEIQASFDSLDVKELLYQEKVYVTEEDLMNIILNDSCSR